MKKITALLTALSLILGLCACSAKNELASWQEQYDLGVRYLSEGNYEEAIIAFNAAIEIDPKQADVYIGLADAYVALGNAERAGQVLEDALTAVSDPAVIQSRLDALSGGEPEPTPTQTPAPGSDSDFVLENGVLVEYTGPGGAVTIPDGVTSIGDYAFAHCTNLTGVAMGNGPITIGDYAFAHCTNLIGVAMGNGPITIGAYAFAHCTNLSGLAMGNRPITIGAYAFADCTNLTGVAMGNGPITIGTYAFAHCTNLTGVTIGNGAANIGDFAFVDCLSLKDVYYGGSEAQWNQIDIGAGNEYLLNAAIHFNS